MTRFLVSMQNRQTGEIINEPVTAANISVVTMKAFGQLAERGFYMHDWSASAPRVAPDASAFYQIRLSDADRLTMIAALKAFAGHPGATLAASCVRGLLEDLPEAERAMPGILHDFSA